MRLQLSSYSHSVTYPSASVLLSGTCGHGGSFGSSGSGYATEVVPPSYGSFGSSASIAAVTLPRSSYAKFVSFPLRSTILLRLNIPSYPYSTGVPSGSSCWSCRL